VLEHYVMEAHAAKSWKSVRRILVDETSARRGHRYVTTVVDADSREPLFLCEGRESEALGLFAQEPERHGASAEQIELVCMDMSPAYRKGAREFFPQATVVFDRFHLMQMAGNALDEVRKALRREGADLQNGLWALRGNQWTRTQEQQVLRRELCQQYPRIGRAMMLRDIFQDILADEDTESLSWWCTVSMFAHMPPSSNNPSSRRQASVLSIILSVFGCGIP